MLTCLGNLDKRAATNNMGTVSQLSLEIIDGAVTSLVLSIQNDLSTNMPPSMSGSCKTLPMGLQNLMLFSDSRAHISGSVERHVNEGSRLSLVCRIESPSAPPSYVYWYRDDDVVNYSNKEGVSIRYVHNVRTAQRSNN